MLLKKDQTLVDEQKDDGFTALHVAALNNHVNVMKILLEQVSREKSNFLIFSTPPPPHAQNAR